MTDTIRFPAALATAVRTLLLCIAVVGALAACGRSTVVRETGSPAARASVPKPGATTVVQRGDTLYGIAFRNGIDVRDLASWNGIGAPYTIYPGQRLRLYPRSGGYTAASRPPPRPSAGAATVARAPSTRQVAPPRAGASPSAPPSRATPPAPVAARPPVDNGLRWRWPADGELLRGFVAGEPTRQGIDIAGAGGAPVRAAADGVVVYSGAGLVGYGELIIIKHDDAWLSAYGHNRKRLVNEGQLVKAGEQIAEMGRSGAARDMLHFEVRYNGKPVDPLVYLPPR
ncbi:peptidoglycan DD-metalloendopeptidase family protein [Cognatilysobacter tabacisoli]|uniref:peptidoglycan DD-metalloendopeptidase family protein n=1 Tax=Cognatilysobacter tabacisoli TaxID=2315424 RepID=UPI000E6AF0F5|nr:peptidoglycan DD-metalloendopeptidase family protein [Lysobacter tabacisoli]